MITPEYQSHPVSDTTADVLSPEGSPTPELAYLDKDKLEWAQQITDALVQKIRDEKGIPAQPSQSEIIQALEQHGIKHILQRELPHILYEIERAVSETMTIRHHSDFEVMRRHRQDAIIKETISRLIQESNGDIATVEGRFAVFTFDVRGLKTVNDLTNDHDLGDVYLEEIAKMADSFCYDVMGPLLTELGIDSTMSLARIGGDEFSISLEVNTNLLHTSGWSIQKLLEKTAFIEQTAHVRKRLEGSAHLVDDKTKQEERTLAEALNELFNYYVPNASFSTTGEEANGTLSEKQKEKGYLFSRKELEDRLGEPLDPAYKYRGYVGTGVATLGDVLKKPISGMYKRSLSGNETASESASWIMGAMRSYSDGASYLSKARQDMLWNRSSHSYERQHYKINTRNNVTRELLQELDITEQELWKEKQAVAELKETVKLTTAALNACERRQEQLVIDQLG